MEYGQSYNTETVSLKIYIYYLGVKHNFDLTFEPYQSLLLRIDQGKLEFIDINFNPKIPVVRKRPDEYKAPWLVGE